MNVSYSPGVLYLTDDDTDTEENNEQPNGLVASASTYHPLPRKKRNFLDASVRRSPVIINANKRQRNEILHFRPTCNQDDSDTILIDADDSIPVERESHSFDVFDWTNDYPVTRKTQSNLPSTRQPLNVRNFLTLPSESRQTDLVIPAFPPASRFTPTSAKSSASPLPLPLPLPKPSYSISHAVPRPPPPPLSRVQVAKHIPIRYIPLVSDFVVLIRTSTIFYSHSEFTSSASCSSSRIHQSIVVSFSLRSSPSWFEWH